MLDTVVTPDFFPLVGRGVSRLMGQPYPKMAISRFEVAPELIAHHRTSRTPTKKC